MFRRISKALAHVWCVLAPAGLLCFAVCVGTGLGLGRLVDRCDRGLRSSFLFFAALARLWRRLFRLAEIFSAHGNRRTPCSPMLLCLLYEMLG